ncbi:MAG: bifunctional phosphopantothenoylcysteine decarboxylase/phosphopantothenate--cysteine ligase CoaBC [Microbacteriaceae bacterium]
MRILVGITGGIAAFKAVSLVRLFTENGHEVKVVPTENALRFVGKTTLEALSKNAVDSDLYTDVADVKHIELAKWAELVVIAPATASFIARTAAGIADDLLSNVVLATEAKVLVAPAMHTEMLLNAATQANLKTLRARGIEILEPESGRLTGSDSGPGRLPEPEQIFDAALALTSIKDLAGKVFVVTAGGTREAIDPVRYITNASSGKQGLAIAKEAHRRGAIVHLVAANLDTNLPFATTNVISASDLATALETIGGFDVLVMAAAVSDYRVASPASSKIKKASVGEQMSIELVQNPDILRDICSKSGRGIVVGFAAETISDSAELEREARAKLERKGCEILVANDVSGGRVFDQDSNDVLILSAGEGTSAISGNKTEVANAILDHVVAQIASN